MDGAAWAVVIAALIAGAFGLAQTIITSRKLGRIEASGERVEARTTEIDTKADAVHDQVRASNGRTLAQVAEDNSKDIDEMRGDLMELAIIMAHHIGDDHAHEMVRKMRQARRDRTDTARALRELADEMEQREKDREREEARARPPSNPNIP